MTHGPDGYMTIKAFQAPSMMARRAMAGIAATLLTLTVAGAQLSSKPGATSPAPGDITAPMLRDYACNKQPLKTNR